MWSQVPVTSLCVLQDQGQVLIGQGQFLVLVRAGSGDTLARLQVFRGAVVHSLQRCGARWLVRGGKSVALVTITEDRRLEVSVPETVHEDWIMASHLSADSLHLLTAHNKLVTVTSVRDPGEGEVTQARTAQCGPCILYSGLLHPPEAGGLTVLAGTVFGKLIIWNGMTGDVINSLEGHDGVIFSVTYCGNTIVTTSDDRSSLVYRCGEAGLTDVSLVHRLRGHSARVFRSLVSEARDLVITAGEDGRVMAWRLTSGDLVQSAETNGGSAVWSLEVSGEDVVSGGGDGSVTRTRISERGDSEGRILSGIKGKPRIVQCVGDTVLIMDDEGHLYSYGSIDDDGCLIFCDNRLSGYCLLEATEDHVVMSGLSGTVISGTWMKSGLVNIKIKQLVEGKIFSLGLFRGGESMVCDKDGQLQLTDANLNVIGVGELPMMKDRWFTASASLGDCIILGDRCGGVHFLTRTGNSLAMRESYPRIHGRHGVTQLRVDDGVVWSSGRDGQLRCYSVSEAGARLVQTVRAHRDWVAGVRRVRGQLSVLTWHGDSLSVRTLASDDLVTSVQCGGGHRSWGVRETGAGGEVIYIKEGRVLVTRMWSAEGRVLLSGGHTQQVNTLRCGEGLIVTGSEDTFIRVYRADTGEQLAVLRGHLSSIKCLQLTRRPDTRDTLVLVSGGGRAELRLWSLATVETRLCCSPLASVMLRPGDGGRGNKKAWRLAQAETQAEGETRFMSVDTVWAGQRLVVGVACSDSSVRVYTLRPGEELEAVCEARQHQHCLLQLRMIPDTDKMLTGSTGGHLSVWTLSEDSLTMETEVSVHQSGVNCLDLRRSEDGWDIVTGGDDTCLVLSRYSGGQITVIWRSDLSCGHTTQLTGLRMVGDLIVTSGVDQRLILWRHTRTEAGERVSWVGSKCVSVADISSLDTLTEDKGRLGVVLVGVGMEKIDIIQDEDCRQ